MIKFFRKIRQNLLLEGKTGKYLKYAIGEIVLVVIGILIALSINNWNETSKANNHEQRLATNLYEELFSMQKYCKEFFLVVVDEELNQLDFLLQNWKNLDISKLNEFRNKQLKRTLKETKPLSAFTGFQFFYNPKHPYYNTANSNGTISLLKDKNFVNQLDYIYISGLKREEYFLQLINQKNLQTNSYIAHEYKSVFNEKNESGTDWSPHCYTKLFESIKEDGTLMYMVDERRRQLVAKRQHIKSEVLPSINKAIEYYEQSSYHTAN